jgi:predicted PhzF superfamily epimerase YddE/YHI9
MERLEPARKSVTFHSSSGPLPVTRVAGGYVMNFPALASESVSMPAGLVDALGAVPLEVMADAINYMVLLDSAATVRALSPDLARIARVDRDGVIVTAAGDAGYDFVSRYFAPARGIPEDPVTGSAHCMLTPYWAGKLGKTTLRAYQASPRGGEMTCRLAGDRVEMEGSCVFYLEGEMQF